MGQHSDILPIEEHESEKGEPLFPRLEAEEEVAYIKQKCKELLLLKKKRRKSRKKQSVFLKLRLINLWIQNFASQKSCPQSR